MVSNRVKEHKRQCTHLRRYKRELRMLNEKVAVESKWINRNIDDFYDENMTVKERMEYSLRRSRLLTTSNYVRHLKNKINNLCN